MNDIFGVGNATNDLDKLAKVQMFAKLAHKESYDGIFPYMYHLRRVAKTIDNFNVMSDSKRFGVLFYAAYLHDVLEDTGRNYNDIKKAFGKDIAEVVYVVTNELGRNRIERNKKTYPKIKGNDVATALKLADRIANMEYGYENHNDRMFSMYAKELDSFEQGIRDVTVETKEMTNMWNHLRWLANQTQREWSNGS